MQTTLLSRTLRGLALAAAAVTATMPVIANADPVVLKVSHFLPAQSPAHARVIVPWCEKIQKESDNRLQCEIYPAMQLGGGPAQLINQVRDGVADIIWTLHGYTPGRFPVSEVFELPFFSTSYEASTRALWEFSTTHASQELRGLKPIAIWTNGPYLLHMRDRRIETLDDLRGMKIRAPSRLGNRLLTALGASPVGMPVPQMAESLARGVIDGALLPWSIVPATKAHEMTQYHAEVDSPNPMITATMMFVMNEARYNRLPKDLQQVIDNNSGADTSVWVTTVYDASDKVGMKAAQGRGNTLYKISADEVAKWQSAVESVQQEWIKDVSGRGMDGQQLLEAAEALIKKYE